MDLETAQIVAVAGLGVATLLFAVVVQLLNLCSMRSRACEQAQPSQTAQLL